MPEPARRDDDHDAGAIVAASYDAKALGIGVGTRIYEAKKLCPGIALVGARHRVYVRIPGAVFFHPGILPPEGAVDGQPQHVSLSGHNAFPGVAQSLVAEVL